MIFLRAEKIRSEKGDAEKRIWILSVVLPFCESRDLVLSLLVCIFCLSFSISSSPIPYAWRKVERRIPPSASLSLLLGSLGSRSIGFPPRKPPRFNEYYVRTRYPVRGVYCARHESSLPIIPASSHGVVIVGARLSTGTIVKSGSLPWSFPRLSITLRLSKSVGVRPCFHLDNYFTDYPWRSSTHMISSRHFNSIA